MAVVRVQAKGQMTVPEPIRKAMGIETGTEFVCIQTGLDSFECHMLPARLDLREYLDAHMLPGSGITQEEINAAVEEGIMADADVEYGALTTSVPTKEHAHSGTGRW